MSTITVKEALPTIERKKFVPSPTRAGQVAVEVLVGNDTPIEVDFKKSGIFFNEYREINAVAGNSTATIANIVVPVGKKFELTTIECSGENKSVYMFEVNGNIQSKKRSYYNKYNVTFKVDDLLLIAGDILKITVENKRNSISDYNTNILGVSKDA